MKSEYVAKTLFVLSVLAGVWGFGVFSYRDNIFPYPQIASVAKTARDAIHDIWERSSPFNAWWYKRVPQDMPRSVTHLPGRLAPGFLLLVAMNKNNAPMIRVVDRQGRTIHEWDVNWWRLWPNPDHLEESERPKTNPGPSPQGVVFMPNGDLVYNYERLGTIRIDYCSRPIWRLPYRTHHSLDLDASGNFWIPGQIPRHSPRSDAPNYRPDFLDFRVLEVSPAGKILNDISIFDVLRKNGLDGLLYLSSINNWGTVVTDDTFHLNDVEAFPAGMAEGFFGRGDLLVSLRNINAILVFNKDTLKVKYLKIGPFVRQHDADFMDGDQISVFDNNNLTSADLARSPQQKGLFSKIVIVNARTDETRVFYRGTPQHPFFSDIMGNHQWLPNGNLLVTESRNGRAFELTSDGKMVWEFNNVVQPGFVGLIKDMQKLPAQFDKAYFARLERSCSGVASK